MSNTSTTTTTEHANTIDDVDTSKQAIDAAARAMWSDKYEWTYSWSNGNEPCGDCALFARRGEPCVCGGTGFHAGEEPLMTYAETACASEDTLKEACDAIADVVAHGRVALERHAAGKPQNDYVPPEAVALLAELAELGPLVARASVLAGKISEIVWPHEDGRDPRLKAREQLRAETLTPEIERVKARASAELRSTAEEVPAARALHVARFDGLERLYAAVAERPGVGRIDMSADAFAAYSGLRDAGVDAKLREHNGGSLPTVHLVDAKGGAR